MLWQSKTMWERCYYAALKMVVAFHSMYLNITFTSARCCNFTTPSSIGMYGITTLFTLLIDDYFPLGGPPDRLKWFPLGKSLRPLGISFYLGNPFRMIFPLASPPDPSEYRRWCPFRQLPPPPPTFMSTFPSYVFLPTWRVSPSSSNFLETSAGTRDSPRL